MPSPAPFEAFADPTIAGVQGVIRAASTGASERSAGRLLGPWHLWGRLTHARSCCGSAPYVASRAVRLASPITSTASPRPRPVEALGATATLFRVAALNSVDGFDERIFMYGEDQDLCVRLGATGWRLLSLPEDWVVHGDGESAPSSWCRELAFWNGTLSYAALNWSTPEWLVGLAAGIGRSIGLIARRPGQVRSVVKGLMIEPTRLRRTR